MAFKIVTANVNTNAAELCRSVSIYAYYTDRKGDSKLYSSYLLAIKNVSFSAGGRQIIDNIGPTETKLLGTSLGVGEANNTNENLYYSNPTDNVYTYNFCQDPQDDSYYSGGISFSALSSQHWKVDVVARKNLDITVVIKLNSYQVVAVSSNDGRMTTGLSV